ncbi:MAG: single-stranded DNA-binding protein [Spirochaetia bacterium]|jgi:single-strand DNA-binding protein|nr:single-stranded DNA-binding protein [Spirochaetia bacterium]
MNNLNSVLVEGNLTRDPVYSETPKGKSVCSFNIATNRYYKQEEEFQNEVSYLDVETWARLADACRDHLTKGRGVRIVGRVKQDRWVDQEGKNKSRFKIVAEHVEFKPCKKSAVDAAEGEAAEAESAAGESEIEETDAMDVQEETVAIEV